MVLDNIMSKKRKRVREIPRRYYYIRLEVMDDSGEWIFYKVRSVYTFSETEARKIVLKTFRNLDKVRITNLSTSL